MDHRKEVFLEEKTNWFKIIFISLGILIIIVLLGLIIYFVFFREAQDQMNDFLDDYDEGPEDDMPPLPDEFENPEGNSSSIPGLPEGMVLPS